MDTKPLLLLDIDGVLNPFRMGDDLAPGYALYPVTVADGRALTVRLTPAHGPWLRELAADFELVWATTWAAQANTHIGPLLGLPVLPVIVPVRRGIYRTEKYEPARRFVKGRPFAWVDDAFELAVVELARNRNRVGRKALLVTSDPAIGLTRAMVDQLHAFAVEVRET